MIKPLSGLNILEYVASFSNSIICAAIASIPTLLLVMNVTIEQQLIYLIFGCGIFAITYLIFTYLTNKKLINFFFSIIKK